MCRALLCFVRYDVKRDCCAKRIAYWIHFLKRSCCGKMLQDFEAVFRNSPRSAATHVLRSKFSC